MLVGELSRVVHIFSATLIQRQPSLHLVEGMPAQRNAESLARAVAMI